MARRIAPIYMDVPRSGDDPMMGIPELPNWGLPSSGGGMGVGANLRKFKPSASGGYGSWQGAIPNSASGMLDRIFREATDGSTRSFDTAANRLRERVDALGQSQKAGVTQGMRGLGGRSGFSSRRQDQVDQNSLFSYGQGLAELEAEFEKTRQQGLQTALGAAGEVSGFDRLMNQLNQQDFGQLRNAANESAIANSQMGFNRANSLDSLFQREGESRRGDALQLLLERMRDRRERDIEGDRNRTQLELGKRNDLSKILALLEGL